MGKTKRPPTARPRRKAATSAAIAPPERKTLSAAEKQLLDECIEQCRVAEDGVVDAMTTLGRFLLRTLFAGRGRDFLEGEEVPGLRVWRELLSHAGGPRIRLNDRVLSQALRMAAWDDELRDDHWRSLDAGRKALLLPLGERPLLLAGARHVMAMGLTQDATRAYVAEVLRQARGVEPAVRLTAGRVRARFTGLRTALGTSAARRRFRELAKAMSDGDRKQLARELEETALLVSQLRADLRGRSK